MPKYRIQYNDDLHKNWIGEHDTLPGCIEIIQAFAQEFFNQVKVKPEQFFEIAEYFTIFEFNGTIPVVSANFEDILFDRATDLEMYKGLEGKRKVAYRHRDGIN